MSLASSEKALSELYCVLWAPYLKNKSSECHILLAVMEMYNSFYACCHEVHSRLCLSFWKLLNFFFLMIRRPPRSTLQLKFSRSILIIFNQM
jgi:hypothetical protein